MPGLLLPGPFQKILVVGPLYDKIEKLAKLEEIALEYDWIIFNSGLLYPSHDLDQVKERIEKLREFIVKYKAAYLVGRTDYTLMAQTRDKDIEHWVNGSYNVAFADFTSRGVVILDGGIPESVSKRGELFTNLEISFVSQINGKPWHDSYNGRVGYVISNNPMQEHIPVYYKHSMQLGCTYGPESPTYAIEVDEISLKKTILL